MTEMKHHRRVRSRAKAPLSQLLLPLLLLFLPHQNEKTHSCHAYIFPKLNPLARISNIRNKNPTNTPVVAMSTPEATQIESPVKNAKDLLPERNTASTNPTLASIFAGLAVSLAMIPEAIAFSFVAGVSPLVGLRTTVVLGFFAALLGGRPGICSSASGACSVVVAGLCVSHGAAYLPLCAAVAGGLQIAAGALKCGKFIRLVPHPVMLGFVNGLAVVMTRAQLTHFRDGASGAFLSLRDPVGASTYGLTALTMALVKLLPKVSVLKAVPPSLGAVTITAVLARVLSLPAKTLADVAGADTFTGGLSVLPSLSIPLAGTSTLAALSEALKIVFPYAATMAAVGCIESLLTMQILDGMADDGKRGSTKRECLAQGVGNVISGFTGGIGGCALLGQSIINMQSGGGASRLSGVSMALFLAVGIVAAAPLLGGVPVAALVGVMLLVCQSTFSWSSLRVLRKIPRLDAAIIALVSFITVKDDLAKAVVAGTVASALGFAWKQSTKISASTGLLKGDKKGENWKVYNLSGPLFFGSTQTFLDLFDVKSDAEDVVIDFTNSRVMDHSALVAINDLADRYGEAGKRVHLRHLSQDCAQLLSKIHQGGLPPYELIERDEKNDPVYGVAEDPSIYKDIGVKS